MEVLVSVLVITLVASIAMPAIGETVRAVRLSSATSGLAADLGRARLEALKRNSVVEFTLTSSTEYSVEFVGVTTLENGVVFQEGPEVVQFAPFGPTLTGPAEFVLTLGGETRTVSLTASGLPVFN